MWNIVVCDGNEAEREQIAGYVRQWCDEQGRAAMVRCCGDWAELYELLRQAEPDTIIVAQDGVTGLDTITSAHIAPQKFIWFSDLDFGVQAYRICVSWFGKKPVTYGQMDKALTRRAGRGQVG